LIGGLGGGKKKGKNKRGQIQSEICGRDSHLKSIKKGKKNNALK